MSRGRKPLVEGSFDWESVFYNSVGSYVQIINIELSKSVKAEPLSKHIRIAGGYAFKSSSYSNEGIPVIRISDFNNEKIILDNVKYYKESDDLKKYELHTGDIVIALTGGTIAKLGIVQQGIGKLYLNQRVGKFEVLDSEEFENEYVYWIARSVQSIIKDLAWGAAIPNVSPKQIEKLKFPIPVRNVQRGIISFLNDLKDNNINKHEYFNKEIELQIIAMHQSQINGTLISAELTHQLNLVKQLRQAFLREAMQGKLVEQNEADEPATELLAKIKAEKEKLIAEKKIKKQKPLPPISEDEIPFEIPKNWIWCRLGEVIYDTEGGKSPSCKNASAVGEEWGVIKTTAVQEMIFLENENKILPDRFTVNPKHIVEEGDVLITRAGPKNRVGIVCCVENLTLNLILSDKTIRILHNKSMVDSKFMALALNSPLIKPIIEKKMTGMADSQVNISQDNMKGFTIPFPPLPEQKRIVSKLDELMTYCDSLEESIKNSQVQNELLLGQVLREALEPKEKEAVG